MTGRRREGVAWVDQLQDGWAAANNMKHHLWWHQAMYSCSNSAICHAFWTLYDTRFRDHGFAADAGGAGSIHRRAERRLDAVPAVRRQGVDIGDRWTELADKAEARIGDCLSAFTLPHCMMGARRDRAVRTRRGA